MSSLPKPAPPPPLERRFLRPRTRLGRATLWTACASLFFLLWGLIARAWSGPRHLAGAISWGIIAAFFAALLAFRWARRGLLWKLRRRLVVSYIFIGVIPVLILLLMGGVSNYLFAGQFATYIVTSTLQSELQHLEAANDALAAQLGPLAQSGKLNEQSAAALTAVSGEHFQHRSVTVWQGSKGFVLSSANADAPAVAVQVPAAIQGNLSAFVMDANGINLRAMLRSGDAAHPLIVISNVPVTTGFLQPIALRLGSVLLIPPGPGDEMSFAPQRGKSLAAQGIVTAGRVPTRFSSFDRTVRFYTIFDLVDWQTGKHITGAIDVASRPSMLYATLFGTLGIGATVLGYTLLGLAGVLGLIELVALFIGLRLSRSITRSVAELYTATEHVNRGDFTHRIEVRGRDQMASLEQSFNSMTDSLVALLAEQQEKQRLESELAIAQEVQKLLFPQRSPDYAPLEVYGTCLPARSVSGDYYDFIPLGAGGLLLAMGDVSGKGISAALLMATVHAFVRAYSLEQDASPSSSTSACASPLDSERTSSQAIAAPQPCSPAVLMATLNYQLFRSTPTEKYATMFLSCYDPAARELTYCNAGHLPPILLGEDGKLTRLDPTATVVGLFEGSIYEQSSVSVQPGDLFLVFSDGVTEPENSQGDFGDQRLVELLRRHHDQPLADIAAAVLKAVTAWIGAAEQPDDITVVLARAH